LFGPYYQGSATNQGYFPEWLISNYVYLDHAFNVRAFYPTEQTEHMFGMSFANKYLADEDMPQHWVNSDGSDGDISYYAYENLLQLASGIQMAGPILTPENFESGMFRAKFPNPGCKGPPMYQACVDYGPNDHSMQGDGHPIWWSNTQRAAGGVEAGTYCYVDHGRRYALGEWPKNDDGLFGPECA
jgi:hypothetical protein